MEKKGDNEENGVGAPTNFSVPDVGLSRTS